MKKQENTQNVIIKLNFDELNKIIRSDDPNGRLLGNHGYIGDNCTFIDDSIILHRFAYLKGTMDAIDLLGLILNNIENCFKFTYYYKNEKHNFVITGYICDDIIIDQIYDRNGVVKPDNKLYNDIWFEIEQEIMIEFHKAVKYYKEYYTRLFDRGRTIK